METDNSFAKEHIDSWTKAWNDHNLKDILSHLGLKKFPHLHFVPVEYFLKDHEVIFEYQGTPDNKTYWSVIEKFEFGKNGLIEESSVYYGTEG
jgi:hypothetical protein